MMPLRVEIESRTFHFKQPAGTSRGTYTTRTSWLVHFIDENRNVGTGECAPLPLLSCDYLPLYESLLRQFVHQVAETRNIPYDALRPYPSMLFGIETAWLHLQKKSLQFFSTPWSKGECGIPINGLIWMGTPKEMEQRIHDKIEAGYRCIKLKIGVHLADEIRLFKNIRASFHVDQLQLRVDANGAFSAHEAPRILDTLASLDIHSIEQPLRAGQWKETSKLCKDHALPIALDEELIGIHHTRLKEKMLDMICPQFLVLKPSLHGGIQGTLEWIQLAQERGIGSWITSALESNVGLHAVAQLAAYVYPMPYTFTQGLGTGQLYTDNIPMPIEIKEQALWHL